MLIVQKYGGTSVGSTERIHKVAQRILATQREGNDVVAVVSAMSGETNRLISLAEAISDSPNKAEMDVLLASGEQVSTALVAMAINAMGGEAVSMSGREAGFRTNQVHTAARIADVDASAVRAQVNKGRIVIVAGFQGTGPDGRITTLGRGGSDLSAIAMASALDADLCQILTDVDGVYTCDPRVVPAARKIPVLCYEEMLELASSGAKVMQSRSVEWANKFGVRFEVRSSLNDNPGTIVEEENPSMESVVVRGISLERDQAEITLAHLPDTPGIAAKVFTALAEADVSVDMIVQNVSDTGASGRTDISFTLPVSLQKMAEDALAPIVAKLDKVDLRTKSPVAKLSIVGIGMRSHSGVAAKMFSALAAADINIQMISTSEIKTAVTVSNHEVDEAARAVHAAFGLGDS